MSIPPVYPQTITTDKSVTPDFSTRQISSHNNVVARRIIIASIPPILTRVLSVVIDGIFLAATRLSVERSMIFPAGGDVSRISQSIHATGCQTSRPPVAMLAANIQKEKIPEISLRNQICLGFHSTHVDSF